MKIAMMSFAHLHSVSYIHSLKRRGDVEVIASDPDHDQRPAGEVGGPALAAELGIDYFDDYASLLAEKPDGVIICSENAKHRELTELAAAAGAHVMSEKPIATSTADARAMIDACAAAGVNLIPLDARSWFVDPALAGGGSLADHTVHVADLLDCLFDGTRAAEVYASVNRILHADKVEVETAGLVSIRYANGVLATIDCSWSKPPSYATWGGLTLQLVGTGGIADMDAFNSRVDGHSELDQKALWLAYGRDADEQLVAEFVSSIAEDRVPQPDGQAGLRSMEIVEAAYESVRSGAPVAIK
jgi:predicted dehydrogenase